MLLDEILQVTSSKDKFEKDDSGIYRMLVNDEHMIHLQNASDLKTFFIYAKVGSFLQDQNNEKLFEHLLEANLFGYETGKAFFSIHQETIILMETFDCDLITPEKFEMDFHEFVNYLIHWKKKLIEESASDGQTKQSSKIIFP